MKIGRNDPCHCGSGQKYKKCCSSKDDAAQVAELAAKAAELDAQAAERAAAAEAAEEGGAKGPATTGKPFSATSGRGGLNKRVAPPPPQKPMRKHAV